MPRLLLLPALLLLAACGRDPAEPPSGLAVSAPVAAAGRMFPYQEHILGNGLRLLTMEDHTCPMVAVQVWYSVGSRDEPAGRQGFAHLFEHLMFRGSDRYGPSGFMDLVNSVGGSVNGFTSFDQTVYTMALPADQLELAFWLEAERMAFLTIDQAGFETERRVVEEERRKGLNRPFGDLYEKGLAAMYKNHPYRHSPIGTIRDLRAATAADAHAWWRDHYAPDRATVVVVGDLSHGQVKALAERSFGWIRPGGVARPAVPAEPLPSTSATIDLQLANAPTPGVGLVWRTCPSRHDDALALDLLASLAGQGPSSRVHRRLVNELAVAVSVTVLHHTLAEDGFFAAIAVVNPLTGDLAAAEKALREELTRLLAEGPTAEELAKAQVGEERSWVFGQASAENKASTLGVAAVETGDLSSLERRLERLRSIRLDDLRRVGQHWLRPDRCLTLRVPGQGLATSLGRTMGLGATVEEESVTAPAKAPPPPGRPGEQRPADWPTQPPMAEPRLQFPDPVVLRDQLPHGLSMHMVVDHELPLVEVALVVPRGAWCETRPGALNLACSLLTRGTTTHDEAALAELLDRQGMRLSASVSLDAVQVRGSCLSERLPLLLDLLAEVMCQPTFPDKPLAVAKSQLVTNLTNRATSPAWLAEREMARQLFGKHPYARPVEGTIPEVEALTRADLVAAWSQAIKDAPATLILVGDVEPKAATALAERSFRIRPWNLPSPPPPPPEAQPPAGPSRIVIVDCPTANQVEIRLAGPGLTQADPRLGTATMVASYFGVAFGSRLNKAIRVEQGRTYGAWGGYDSYRFAGRFQANTFTRVDQTAATINQILGEIRRLVQDPPTPDEIQRNRRFQLGSLPRRYETCGQITGRLAHLAGNQLPDDHFKRLYENIGRATPADCLALAQATIDPTRMLIVVAGPAKTLAPALAGIAPVQVVDGSGKIVDSHDKTPLNDKANRAGAGG